MSDIGKRVKLVREERGWTLQQLAAKSGNLAYQTIQDLEKGKSRGTKHLLALASALGVSPSWLESETGPKHPMSAGVNHDTKLSSPNGPDRLTHAEAATKDGTQETFLRVLGMAEGGPDGWNLWNGEEIGRIRRPNNLLGVAGAYSVYVTGNSMVPRFEAGELVHIHPHKPPTPGCYVLVQKKPIAEGEPPLAIIKRLVKRSGKRVILAQLTPAKEFEISADEIVSMHRVVGYSED